MELWPRTVLELDPVADIWQIGVRKTGPPVQTVWQVTGKNEE